MAETTLNTVRIGVSTLDETKRRLSAAFRGEPQGQFISFASIELMWKTLTPKRWELIRIMTAAGPMTIREAARRIHRDVKAVHGDIQALLKSGVLEKTEDGRVLFPYDAVHVDFTITAAA